MKIVGIVGRKGGVGKSTLAVNLASCFYEKGSVELVDADPQGSASDWIGKTAPFPVRHVTDCQELSEALQSNDNGVMLVDGPPYDIEANKIIVSLSDLVVVPVTPSLLDIKAALPLLNALKTGKTNGIAVMNLTMPRSNATKYTRATLESHDIPVADTELVSRVAHRDAVAAARPVTVSAPSSAAANEIRALSKEIWKVLSNG